MDATPESENDGVRSLVGYFLFVLAACSALAIAVPPTVHLFAALPDTVQTVVVLVGLLAAVGGAKAFGTLQQTRNKLVAGLSFVIMAIVMALALIACVYESSTKGSDSIWSDGVKLSLFALAFGIPGLGLVLQRKSTQSPEIL